MTFKIDGFLSPGMEKFSGSLRTVPEYKAWFEFAEGLNRLVLRGWKELNRRAPITKS